MKADDNQNKKLVEKFKGVDFSKESLNKEKNLELLKIQLKNLEKREIVMKKSVKRTMVVAATVAALLCVSLAVYGGEFFNIVKSFKIGKNVKYNVVEDKRPEIPVPAGLEGKLFYENGKMLKNFPPQGRIFNAEGKEVQVVWDASAGAAVMVTMEEFENMSDNGKVQVKNLDEARKYFATDILVPQYLPDGYSFDYAEFYGESLEDIKSNVHANKYMGIFFTNGSSQILCDVQYLDGEKAMEVNVVGDAEKATINGNEAMVRSKGIDVKINNVLYMFHGDSIGSKEQMIKIVESMK